MAIFRHWKCFQSSVAKDGKDGHVTESFNAVASKLMTKKENIMIAIIVLRDEICLIASLTLT